MGRTVFDGARSAVAALRLAKAMTVAAAVAVAMTVAVTSSPVRAGSAPSQERQSGTVGDSISRLLARTTREARKLLAQNSAGSTGAAPNQSRSNSSANNDGANDPRAGDKTYEQAQRLMRAIDAILKETAENRSDARKLPSKKDFIVPPIWTETKEDRQRKIRDLLDAALGIVTDAPIVDVQKRIETLRKNIRELETAIVDYRERKLVAPNDGMLPGLFTDTKDSLQSNIDEAKARVEDNKDAIAKAKGEIHAAMAKAGIKLTADQIDLLMESVLSGDLVRLIAAFKAAKIIDAQLGKLVGASADNLSASRKYFAMHAALFAMLKHAQDGIIAKIDKNYLPKLRAIEKDIRAASSRTKRLLRASNRPDQRRALKANRASQRLAREAARGYRRYLLQQREQIAQARRRATHDLNIADNTYETVEASFQLRNLMRDSTTSFEALQRLEAPTFDQIFRNEELRKEFENLTKRLEVPTS